MTNPLKEVRPLAEEKRFGLIAPVGLTVVAGLGWFVFGWRAGSVVLWSVAIIVLALRFAFPKALRPGRVVATALADAIATVLTWVLLTVMFYLIITPVGLLRRLFGADPLRLRPTEPGASHWLAREDRPDDPERWKKQF